MSAVYRMPSLGSDMEAGTLIQWVKRPGERFAKGEIDKKIDGDNSKTAVFLPTTPNPTSGFLLFVPTRDLIELDMTVEDAAKLVISAGLVYPNGVSEAPTPIGEVRQPPARAS